MSDTFENTTTESGNISSAEFMQMASQAGEAAEAKVDHSYDDLPKFEPQAVDPVDPETDRAITEAVTAREYDIRFNLDKIEEAYKLDEMADSVRTIAFINWANSKQDPIDINYDQWVADGMEAQYPFKNKANFASAKSNNRSRIGGANAGVVISNTVTTPAAPAPVYKEPEPLDDETQALLDRYIALKSKHKQTTISAAESADDLFTRMEKKMRNFILGRSNTLTLLAGAPGVGKTYTLQKVIDDMLGKGAFKEVQSAPKKIPNSEYRLVWLTDAPGGKDGLIYTVFINRKNAALIFNDCDVWLGGRSESATNILKNILEAKQSYVQIEDPEKGGAKSPIVKHRNMELSGESDMDESIEIGIDMDELRENSVLRYYINGNLAGDESVPMNEACRILKSFGEKPNFKFMNESWAQSLKEASIFDDAFNDDDADIDTDNSTGMDSSVPGFDPDYVDERRDEHGKVVRIKKFAFNSRVMFITNKHKDDIDEAIFDRADSMDIQLTPAQFLARLAQIKDKIDIGYAGVDAAVEDWARKHAYGSIEMLIKLNEKNQRVDGEAIVIDRDSLSFRMYKNVCTELMSLAETWLDDPSKYGCATLQDCIANPRFDKTVFERISDYVAGLV